MLPSWLSRLRDGPLVAGGLVKAVGSLGRQAVRPLEPRHRGLRNKEGQGDLDGDDVGAREMFVQRRCGAAVGKEARTKVRGAEARKGGTNKVTLYDGGDKWSHEGV